MPYVKQLSRTGLRIVCRVTSKREPGVPVTIHDVARHAGVHTSTVSRTFSAPQLVRESTRRRVESAAQELGYRPNRAARGLITGRTYNLALIVADIANPFFPPLIKTAQQTALSRDYTLFVADTDEDPSIEDHLVHTLTKQVDGAILAAPRMTNRQLLQLHEELPLVLVNRRVAGVPAIVLDAATGVRRAVEHLVTLGHRRLSYVAGPARSWTNTEIRSAIIAACDAASVQLTVLDSPSPTVDGGQSMVDAVLATKCTAVIGYNDLIAIGLLRGLDRRGVAVPAEISVVGSDDIGSAEHTTPRLTTVSAPTALAGRLAVETLLHALSPDFASGSDLTTLLGTELIIRDSTAPPPSV